MKIYLESLESVLDELKGLLKNKFYYIGESAFPITTIRKLEVLKNEWDSLQYGYDNQSDIAEESLHAWSVKSLCSLIETALEQPDLAPAVDGVVDIAALDYKLFLNETLYVKQEKETMNMSNLEYLQEQVKFTGFGDELTDKIAKEVENTPEKFAIPYDKEFGKDSVSVNLNFSKSKESDMYFFNSYEVNLQKQKEEKSTNQTFYINKKNNITLKEAYNLLSGRSVYKKLSTKDGNAYSAWIELDFKQTDNSGNFKLKQFNDNYGYDLESALGRFPIKELESDELKANLLSSLKRGNVAVATFKKGDSEVERFITANPQFKNINVYDVDGKKVGANRSTGQAQSNTEGEAVQTGAGEREDAKAETSVGQSESSPAPETVESTNKVVPEGTTTNDINVVEPESQGVTNDSVNNHVDASKEVGDTGKNAKESTKSHAEKQSQAPEIEAPDVPEQKKRRGKSKSI
ncbi:hypothetical protein MUB18_20520 [Sphingobacterium sp. PCS056]|uniref:hypothetical protein n=1 Tax=Sphingobacterium sp. PCS056 TaxID=2931400 RepID=UPI00200CD8B1|nr:hypothetical protein [Sphingobacterium sp. PCS056]UPZ36473.1 hypothetical protein MUB18_20520 [Sphingobacterium sp. PCS056]